MVQDLAIKWIQSHPCTTRTSKETEKSLRKFFEPSQKPEVVCTDNTLEFGNFCEEFSWNHRASVANSTRWCVWDTIRRDGVGEGGRRRCVYTCTPHQAHHTLPPVAIFSPSTQFLCAAFFLFLGMHVFSCSSECVSSSRMRLCLRCRGTSGDCKSRASCEFRARRDVRSARMCDASSGGQLVAPALRIRSASTSARGRDTCTCEEVRGTCTSSDLRDTRAAVPCRVLNGVHHGRHYDRRKPGRHDLGNLTVLYYGCSGVATRENHGHLGLGGSTILHHCG